MHAAATLLHVGHISILSPLTLLAPYINAGSDMRALTARVECTARGYCTVAERSHECIEWVVTSAVAIMIMRHICCSSQVVTLRMSAGSSWSTSVKDNT